MGRKDEAEISEGKLVWPKDARRKVNELISQLCVYFEPQSQLGKS